MSSERYTTSWTARKPSYEKLTKHLEPATPARPHTARRALETLNVKQDTHVIVGRLSNLLVGFYYQ
ncbi:hypothetical protein Pyrfu_0442 [Pyrolobus fumarii 1A]|uniref:Uncharacterized protein n=1 Tax=Pyrolobus fumarii (strain DSM 11204 / 1A) TaxID=694429 RepID=G0EG65_PYRF1|nr:hypothetical protein [Pyrolobus fumarii]AEM38313.1 hypothetical protein Pyrfu_0442 [Pyrolobus fumarii 1A]